MARAQKRRSYEENPIDGGLVTGVLVLAAVGITYLMFREKPGKEPTPAPAPTPPAPATTPPPVVNFTPPLPLSTCNVSVQQFNQWAQDKGYIGIWSVNTVGTPPSLAELKLTFPEHADVNWDKFVVAMGPTHRFWSYDSAGVPHESPWLKQSFCTWKITP